MKITVILLLNIVILSFAANDQIQSESDKKSAPVEKKPAISVSGIDDNGVKTDAVLKEDNATQIENHQESKTVAPEPKNETEAVDSDFLPAEGAAEKEHSSSLAIFFVLFVLVLCIFLIHFILQTKCHYIPESLAIVFLGAFIGAIIRLMPNEEFKKVESFSPTTFFLVLLPPIIFESGYNLHKVSVHIIQFISSCSD